MRTVEPKQVRTMAIYRRDIRLVAKKFEEKLTDLLWISSREELQQFIIGYAKEQRKPPIKYPF